MLDRIKKFVHRSHSTINEHVSKAKHHYNNIVGTAQKHWDFFGNVVKKGTDFINNHSGKFVDALSDYKHIGIVSNGLDILNSVKEGANSLNTQLNNINEKRDKLQRAYNDD
jgi:hypothetical protein